MSCLTLKFSVYDLLKGMTVVEGSAFVAAPLCGMTLAQLGAEVIRFDQIGGGPDYQRWELTRSGRSLYWMGLNKGKKSIAVDFRTPEGNRSYVFTPCLRCLDRRIRIVVQEFQQRQRS